MENSTAAASETATITSSPAIHRAWSMYDWANSAYNLVITSTIFPAFYIIATTGKDGNKNVSFFGHKFLNEALFTYTLSAAYLIIVLLSPILSSIADYKGNKKAFMRLFCYIGSLACCCLYFFDVSQLELGMISFGIAAVGYCGSLVFYNAFLPEIAYEDERDKVSAQGFAYGYIGSVILQVICLVFEMKPEWFGIKDPFFPSKLSFLLTGLWWFGFAHITFAKLPRGVAQQKERKHSLLVNGFHELRNVWNQVKRMKVLSTYLVAFFFYSTGVQTVMLAATIFGSTEVVTASGKKLGTTELIVTILIIQLVAIAGAYLMSKLSEQIGNLKVLLMVVFVWIGVCVGAYYTHTDIQFYILATVVGLVMGGIQSLSRSTYSKLMPPTHDTASFFSFYDVTEKLAIVIGTASFAFINEWTGNMRYSILMLICFFVVGAIILYFANRRFQAGKVAELAASITG